MDVIERLTHAGIGMPKGLLRDAADEIARLRAELEAAKGEAEALREGIVAARYLMDNSDGVYGMHLNGAPSPWAELRTGGRFEAWLVEFDDAMAAIDAARGE